MRLCVINFSGNVGKTTVSANFLKPRLDAHLFSIETINQDAEGDGVEAKRMRAQQFGALLDGMLLAPRAIVDVGSSNVEAFLEYMQRYDSSHEDYDYFVVPTVKERKQVADTVATIEALLSMGVEGDRIKVLFNKIERPDDLLDDFAPLFGFAMQKGIELNPRARLELHPVFDEIKDHDQTLAEVIADPTDHRALLAGETTDEARAERIRRLSIKRLATRCARDMDQAYAALFARAPAVAG
ncbi:StbB family protein [Ideonella sp. DXS29W]|uniref:StbB family protein n=1 Tax=Ideonella lacteola TaxID=2984193 RepID=A0ABU9BW76_9BURK